MTDDPHVSGLSLAAEPACTLTDEEQMLVLVRDELYEGDWDDFMQDLQDRLAGNPHLFDIQPASLRLQETIRSHLRLIERLRGLEEREQVNLRTWVKPR